MLLQSSASKANSIKSQASSTVFYWKLLGFYLLKTLNVGLLSLPTVFFMHTTRSEPDTTSCIPHPCLSNPDEDRFQ